MGDIREMMYAQQMMELMRGGDSWFSVVVLAILFAVLLFRSDRIRYPTLFRWSCTLFALSILVPPVFLVAMYFLGAGGPNRDSDPSAIVMVLERASGPVLLGFSLMLAFASLAPTPVVPDPPAPQRHPLD